MLAVCHGACVGRKRPTWAVSVNRNLPGRTRSPGTVGGQEVLLRCLDRAAAIELTPTRISPLTAWVRAGTTPQRLARRARLILGSAAGLGSRAAGSAGTDESNHRPPLAGPLPGQALRRTPGSSTQRPTTGHHPDTRALIVALACERPAERNVPLSRYSLSELTAEVAADSGPNDVALSRSSVWRVLKHDALRPWRYRCWIFPRDPHFLELAGPVLDLYACHWQGRPLWADEYVLSADEKTSIQVRRRTPPDACRPVRLRPCASNTSTSAVERCSTWPPGTSIAPWSSAAASRGPAKLPSDAWSTRSWSQEPYRSARRVFWIVDNGSSHRGERAADELRARHPRVVIVHTPVHASWLNQIEIYFSIIQRKVLTPNDCTSLDELIERIPAFGNRYSALDKPFAWRFTSQDLERRLRDPLLQPELVTPRGPPSCASSSAIRAWIARVL